MHFLPSRRRAGNQEKLEFDVRALACEGDRVQAGLAGQGSVFGGGPGGCVSAGMSHCLEAVINAKGT